MSGTKEEDKMSKTKVENKMSETNMEEKMSEPKVEDRLRVLSLSSLKLFKRRCMTIWSWNQVRELDTPHKEKSRYWIQDLNIHDRRRVVRPTWPNSPVYNLLSIYLSSIIYVCIGSTFLILIMNAELTTEECCIRN